MPRVEAVAFTVEKSFSRASMEKCPLGMVSPFAVHVGAEGCGIGIDAAEAFDFIIPGVGEKFQALRTRAENYARCRVGTTRE